MSEQNNPYKPPSSGGGDDQHFRPPGEEPPRYGARSENWGKEPQAQPAEPERPWPVYGEDYLRGSPAQASLHNQMPGQPHSPRQYQPPSVSGAGAPTPYMSHPAPQSGPMPTRTGPVLTIILGVVLMVIIAPTTMVVMILQGIGFSKFTDNSLIAVNGGPVVVDETGAVGLSPMDSGTQLDCVLQGAGGPHVFEPELEGSMFVVRGVNPGQYTLQCEGMADGSQVMIMSGDTLDTLMPTSIAAMGWASLIGFLGLVALIVGIVWLVKRNRARKGYLQGY